MKPFVCPLTSSTPTKSKQEAGFFGAELRDGCSSCSVQSETKRHKNTRRELSVNHFKDARVFTMIEAVQIMQQMHFIKQIAQNPLEVLKIQS